MKKYVQMVVVLLTISVVSGLVMGVVNKWTAPIIAKNLERKALGQYREIFKELDTMKDISEDVELEDDITAVHEVYDKNGALVGYIVELTGRGHEANLKLIIGVEPSGTIRGLRSPDNNETAGYGKDKLNNKQYLKQFERLEDPSTIVTNAGINAGVTNTTTGVVNALRKARSFVLGLQGLTDPVEEAAEAIFGFGNYNDVTGDFEDYENDHRKALYTVTNKQGNVLGYMFLINAPGAYREPLETYIGIDLDGYIVGIAYGEFNETDGWGAKVKEEAFINEFIGRSSIDQIDTNKIDEILGVEYKEGKYGETGATENGPGKTRAAMLKAVKMVFDYFAEKLNEQIETILGLFNDSDSYDKLYLRGHEYILNIYEVFDADENVLGYVYKTNAVKSYNEPLEIFFALNLDGEVVGMTYGAFNETPFLGGKAKDQVFIDAFIGVSSVDEIELNPLKDHLKDADTGMTASTTLNSIVNALDGVFKHFKEGLFNEEEALKTIYSETVGYKRERTFIPDSVLKELYIVLDGENEVGYAFRVEAPGAFIGVEMIIGLDLEGKVKDLFVTVNEESPADEYDNYGGALLENEEFLNQFKGKSNSDEIDGIDAVTEGTRTLKSVKKGVQHVLDYYKENLSK